VFDNEALVKKNRTHLSQTLNLPGEPTWLDQTHSTDCVIAEEDENRIADAAITRATSHPLVILTADCLPITLCSMQGDEIAAIHAGWKGLFNGIIENTLDKMHSANQQIIAWIGPAICQNCYEVGEEVYLAFTTKYPMTQNVFKPTQSKWVANLALMAEMILLSKGIQAVYQSGLCTYELESEFYSYRRAAQTGRIATLIWFNTQP
jgi:YfiH family protein